MKKTNSHILAHCIRTLQCEIQIIKKDFCLMQYIFNSDAEKPIFQNILQVHLAVSVRVASTTKVDI